MAKAPTRKSSKKGPKKTKAAKSAAEMSGEGAWPSSRQVMFRPDRVQYVRKMVKPVGCVFCNALKGGVGFESLVLATEGEAMLVLNKYPYNTGHLLALPKRHTGEFTELTEQEAADIHALLSKAMRVLKEVYSPAGFNMGLNHGAVAGAGIPEHLHWHLLPRWAGDANFYPLIAETKVVVETLEQTYERLAPFFR